MSDIEDRAASRYAVILAGGAGTRLWPLSRASKPKQLLALNGDESLLQQTVRRVLPAVAAANVMTVTHADHYYEVVGQLHGVDGALAGNVLAEPIGRNTLPAIFWAVARIAARAPDAVIGVFSSDHSIADTARFHAAWRVAERAARSGRIALLGMAPDRPATGFGYIQAGARLGDTAPGGPSDPAAHEVERFVEKPDAATAEGFLREGGYLWNGGIFVFRADVFIDAVRQFQPGVWAALDRLVASGPRVSRELYATLPDVSIDKGILERAGKIAVVPVEMGWSDLGSWDALYREGAKDADGNLIRGQVVGVESRNNLLWSEHGVLGVLGLEDVAVVQTRDATLVCPRALTGDLKHLVSALQQAHREVTETHIQVTRPWGSYTVLEEGPGFKIKRIVVNPGARLSLQLHHHRSEHWVVVAGTAQVLNGEQEILLEENQSTYIARNHRHRLGNPGKIPLQIIEIQSGPYLDESDIVRFQDDFERE